jgi:hypothetical protein
MAYPSRRAFLGKGTVLALGALVASPHALTAAPALPNYRSRADEALAAIRAILDAPIPDYFDPEHIESPCRCRDCVKIRRVPFLCAACGYSGTPIVLPCDCRERRRQELAYIPKAIAAIENGTEGPNGWGLGALPHLRRELAEYEAQPDRMCRASTSRAARRRQRFSCGHGTTYCPSCAASDRSPDPQAEACNLAGTIRAVREVLAGARGRA